MLPIFFSQIHDAKNLTIQNSQNHNFKIILDILPPWFYFYHMVDEIPHYSQSVAPEFHNNQEAEKEVVNMFGEFIKSLRIERDIGLREFCRRLSIDASNWSKVERGILAPPQDSEKFDQIAEVLGINKNSQLYIELIDKASIDAGIIPKDILSDRETLNSLPMFFRTIRSEKPTPEELEKLIKRIRGDG